MSDEDQPPADQQQSRTDKPQWRTVKRKKDLKAAKADKPVQAAGETEVNAARRPEFGWDTTARGKRLAALGSPSSFLQVPRQFLQQLSQYYGILTKMSQLQNPSEIKETYGRRQEFAISPVYAPEFVDAACQSGIFPMSTAPFRDGPYFFAAKLHTERATAPVKPGMTLPEGLRRISKKYSVVINAFWDEVVAIINKQHGENWLCAALRKVFLHMFLDRKLPTKLSSIAILDNSVLHEIAQAEAAAAKGEGGDTEAVVAQLRAKLVVAGEIGFTVGDIYTSLTGGYTVDGTGSLQLGMLGMLLAIWGYGLWDLGMSMAYKEKALGTSTLTRARWLDTVASRRGNLPRVDDSVKKLDAPGSNEAGLGQIAGRVLECKEVYEHFARLTAATALAA